MLFTFFFSIAAESLEFIESRLMTGILGIQHNKQVVFVGQFLEWCKNNTVKLIFVSLWCTGHACVYPFFHLPVRSDKLSFGV